MAIVARKTRNGTSYTAVYRYQGIQKSAGSYPERKLAEAAYMEAMAKVLRGIDPSAKPETVYPGQKRGELTVAAFAERWIEEHPLESERTRYNYRNRLSLYILPRFGAEPMSDITTDDVATWFRKMEADGWTNTKITGIKVVLSSMFQSAAAAGRRTGVASNPVRGIRLVQGETKRRAVFSLDQYATFHAAIPEHYKLLTDFMTQSGLRWMEAMGLRAEDLAGNIITVRGVLEELPAPHRFHYRPRTKTGKIRQVKIPTALADRLRERASEGYIFLTPTGRHIHGSYFRVQVWQKALDAAGLSRNLTPRDLRRTHATWLRKGGATLEEVRNRLGHSTVAMTDRYLGEIEETEDAALAAMERILTKQ